MKALFEHVSDTITGIAGEPVRMVDFDLGQLEQEPMPSLSYPAVLVSFDVPQYANLGAGAQQAETVITLRVAFRVWERTHSKAQPSFREIGLAHLDTLQTIHSALQGSSGDCFSPLVRLSMTTERRADLRVYELRYTTEHYEPATTHTPWKEITEDDGEGNQVAIPAPELCVNPNWAI